MSHHPNKRPRHDPQSNDAGSDRDESVNQWGKRWKVLIYVGLTLTLIAILTYVLSFNDSMVPGRPLRAPIPAAP